MVSYLDLEDEKDSKDWDKRKDNRDTSAMSSWDPPDLGVTEDMISKSFQYETLYSRSRQLLLRSIASAVHLSEDLIPVKDSNVNNGVCPSSCLITNLTNLTSSLESHWMTCCKVSAAPPPLTRHPPQAPSCPSLGSYQLTGQVDTVLNMLELAVRLHQGQVDSQTKEMMEGASKHLEKGLETLGNKITSSSSQLLERGELLEFVVWFLESVGLSAILCGVVMSLIRGVGGAGGAKGGKKGKKGKGTVLAQFSCLLDSYKTLVENMQEVAKKLLELTENLEAKITTESLTESLAHVAIDKSVDDGLAKEIVIKMEKSYTESFYQIKTILKNKQNYLGFLRL